MKLPIIRRLSQFAEERGEDYLNKTIETLEYVAEMPGLKDEEIDVIGELLSDMYGAVEVEKLIKEGGMERKDALNAFMKRVLSAINK